MLNPGKSLSHYTLVEKIGQGGMGEVWRATDGRLDREVALKILPDAVARDHSRLDRFTREAKLLASLNHPSIATIHDVDEHEGVRFIVMELVPGLDLGQMLERGALPMEEALNIGVEIARALEVAHGQGVVHRDLKPANVKRTPDNKVKVLDFGLAKAMDPEASSGDPNATSSPTVTSAGTMAGVILGTAAYMSPEQARGKPIDKRTDVWSFGVLLYELLTGDNPFRGGTVADSVGAIMHRDPDLDILPPQTPSAVKRLLRRCLVRERSDRLHDIADARIELEEAIANPVVESGGSAVSARPSKLPWIALAVLLPLAVLITGWIFSSEKSETKLPLRKFVIEPDAEVDEVEISPDGSTVAYIMSDGLHIRTLDSLESRLIYEADGADITAIFWSPDSQRIGVTNLDGEINSVPLTGAAPTLLTSAKAFSENGSWSDDGYIYFSLFQQGISRIPEVGGAVEEIDVQLENLVDLHGISALPGNEGILAVPHLTSSDPNSIYVIKDGEPPVKLLEVDASIDSPRYSTSGHLLYYRAGNPRGYWAVPFSLSSLKVTGKPFLIESDLKTLSLSDGFDMVYAKSAFGEGGQEHELVWLDSTGAITERYDEPIFGNMGQVAVSPDGTRVALIADRVGTGAASDSFALWVIDTERRSSMKLTEFRLTPGAPVWNQDGSRIAIVKTEASGTKSIVHVAADGSGDLQLLTEADVMFFFDLSRDWSTLLFVAGEMGGESGFDIFAKQLGDSAQPSPAIDGPNMEVGPKIHPDGQWLLYSSGVLPSLELFVQSFPVGSGRYKVSRNTNLALGMWSYDGRWIYYESRLSGGSGVEIYRVSFDGSGAKPEIGQVERLFDLDTTNGVTPAPDGSFLAVLPVEDQSDEEFDPNGIVIIQNWLSRF